MFVKNIMRRWAHGFLAVFLSFSVVGIHTPVTAQTNNSDVLRALQNAQENRTFGSSTYQSPVDQSRQDREQRSEEEELSRYRQMEREAEPSALERDYRSRLFDVEGESRRRANSKARREQLEQYGLLGERAPTELYQFENMTEDPRERLQQFGYDMFNRSLRQPQLTVGRAPADYILGTGDEVVVTLQGSTERSLIMQVDREGRLVLPDIAPINAAGRKFSEVEADVRRNVEASLLGTEAFVSLGAVRMMSVFVLGEVREPGVQRVTSLSSVIEALSLAGGVQKTGTLRNIRVLRNGEAIPIDLYDVLLGNPAADLLLRDGDQIVVPPVGETFAVAGQVNRPGIFELKDEETGLSVSEALRRAGGTLRPRGYRYSINHVSDDGRQLILDTSREEGRLQAGDILTADLMQDIRVGSVRVLGHVNVPSYVSLQRAPTLSSLIYDVDLLAPNPYLPYAVVETTDPDTQARVLKPVNLERVLRGLDDYEFRDSDWLYVFGLEDIKFLSSPLVRWVIVQGTLPDTSDETQESSQILRRRTGSLDPQQQAAAVEQQGVQDSLNFRRQLDELSSANEAGQCRGLDLVARIVSDTRSDRFSNAVANIAYESVDEINTDIQCPEIFDLNEELLPFLLEHVVAVHGSVRRPGVYPITSETSLESLIQVAGGVMETADLTTVEFLSYSVAADEGRSEIERRTLNLARMDASTVSVSPGSAVRFNQVLNQQENGGILLTGEFARPGFYSLRRGETLSQVMERAGGVTRQAYPYGAVFTRESAREAQEQGLQRAARELNAALTLAAVANDADTQGLAALQATAAQLDSVEAVGRVVIEADPAVLSARPALDVVLEPGDRLHMPKRPSSVTVSGDVLNPGTLQFFPGKSVDAYLSEAGGYQQSADKGRVFIVYPNGAAEPVSRGFASFGRSQQIPPGTAIVVPKDVTPFDWRTFAVDMTQIFSQLAISAVAIDSIND